MASSAINDRITILQKRCKAESLELQARRLRQEAAELERNLLTRPEVVKRFFALEY